MNKTTLAGLKPGEIARIARVETQEDMRRRLNDIGLTEGTAVKCVGSSPLGDPSAYMVRGAVIALRREICDKIIIG